MRRCGIALAAAATAFAVALSGCGSDKGNNSPTATVGSSGAQVDVGNTINYTSYGTTADVDCADGKSINVVGSDNTLTVKGTCGSVNIGGANNKITFEKVDKEISTVGVNNTVSYKAGDPKISNLGADNKISKG